MIMDKLLKQLVDGTGVTPPPLCAQSFASKYPQAINPEWQIRGERFEVIFHLETTEYVAEFDSNGLLVKYTMQLTVESLPGFVSNQLSQKGELMNAVLVNEGNQISYEIIYRNADLSRFMMVLDQSGNIITEKEL